MLVNELFEARKTDKDVKYSLTEVKGKVERVTVSLAANKSGVFTKLAARYKDVDVQLQKLQLERDMMNAELKSEFGDLFDAEDEILTRVIQTVSLTATLAKQSAPGSKTDDTAVVLKLLEEATPELKEKIEELRKLFTATTKARSPSLSVDYPGKAEAEAEIKLAKKKAGLKEGVASIAINALKSMFKRKLREFRSWTAKYDKKLDKIKMLLGTPIKEDGFDAVRAAGEKIGATHFMKGVGFKTAFYKKEDGTWLKYEDKKWVNISGTPKVTSLK